MAKKGWNNWLVGAFVVNKGINDIPLENRGNFSTYNLMYKKENSNKDVANFGEVRHRHCHTEYGQIAAHLFCEKTYRINNDRLLSEEEIAQVMRKGDELYEAEANGNVDEQYSIDEWIDMLVNKYLVSFKIAEEGTDLDMNDSFINHEHNINYDAEAAEIERQREVNNEHDMSMGLYTETNSDNNSFMTRWVKNHKKYTRITADNRRLCPTASSMENIAHEYKKNRQKR
jgi:hypothetical protein